MTFTDDTDKIPYMKELARAMNKEPTVPQPGLDELGEMGFDGIVEATDGCMVEPDGICEHGYPSWFLKLGII